MHFPFETLIRNLIPIERDEFDKALATLDYVRDDKGEGIEYYERHNKKLFAVISYDEKRIYGCKEYFSPNVPKL